MKIIKMSIISIFFLFILFSVTEPYIQADELYNNPSKVSQGSLLIRNKEGYFKTLPLLDTQVKLSISGLVARVIVKQFFENTSEDFVEASYVFPLPEDSAVDHMDMLIGERRIIGEIKEKAEAKKIYKQAKRQGKKTALFEQKRANIFTTKVANIAPGETVEIMIEYQQQVHFKQGEFSLRFPSSITPRYHPSSLPKTNTELKETFSNAEGTGWGLDPEKVIYTPTLPANSGVKNSISIDVELDAGLPLKAIESPYHNIVIQKKSTGKYLIALQNYQISNRDFEIRWKAEQSAQPRVALFSEKEGNDDYLLLMITPPEMLSFNPLPREVTLIIDQSGSMEGASMVQAISALQQALKKLTSDDRFNVIAFNHQTRSLFNRPVDVNQYNIAMAEKFVGALEADGGTEMLPALRSALSESTSEGFVRQIVFLTDGAVSNEDELFAAIHNDLASARLFTIGIGSAPNSYFMRKAAQFGRGTFTYIGKPDEVAEKMGLLFEQLEKPVMQNIHVDWPMEVEQFPSLIPDLYLGEPLRLRVKGHKLAGEININGQQGQTLWQATIPVGVHNKRTKASSGIGVLWARSKISELLDLQIISPEETQIKQQVIDLALEHHLVSRYTSLVAVEQISTRPYERKLESKSIANHLPAGTTFGYPSTATGWKFQLMIGVLLLLISILMLLLSNRKTMK
ncbi:MAG: marine proteobacterial sortase target protein [Gammaproteobacteria bacterium]|nr:marine proteobacterial sortase target protein [Gammaproteobacteria bacterium]